MTACFLFLLLTGLTRTTYPSSYINLLKVTKEIFDVTISEDLSGTQALRRRFLVFRLFFDQVSARPGYI